MEDIEIVRLYLERSQDAILETEKKYGRYCHKIAFNVLGSIEDSEECVNDAYMRTWGSIPPNEPTSLSAYVGKITRNLALDRYRQRSSGKRGFGEVPVLLDELAECIADEDVYEKLQDSEDIRNAINGFLMSLPEEERKVFMRRYWQMEPIADIANRYDMSVSKATTMLFRLRNKLKIHLMKEGITL
ncbi:MAG: sigma-70 family RNA polymerase sigma factor [Oscillospiraceae bacterium]|nr:sigma-70 family RNA polymerase sigma factor [Oscillospiraceae bacterium]